MTSSFVVLNLAMSSCTTVFFWLGCILSIIKAQGRDIKPFWLRAWLWLKYPAAVGCFSTPITEILRGHRVTPLQIGLSGFMFVLWWFNRDNFDDDFKKKARRLLEKIREVAGKLVVVPETA